MAYKSWPRVREVKIMMKKMRFTGIRPTIKPSREKRLEKDWSIGREVFAQWVWKVNNGLARRIITLPQ